MKHCVKQRIKKSTRNKQLVKVSDDWYPSLPGGYVSANYYFVGKNPNGFVSKVNRVSFWGDDDFGLEKFYETREEAEKEYNTLIKKVLSKEILKGLGFIAA